MVELWGVEDLSVDMTELLDDTVSWPFSQLTIRFFCLTSIDLSGQWFEMLDVLT